MPDIYKMVNATQLDSDLTDIADSIRTKTRGSALLAFPTDFITEIDGIISMPQPPQTPTDSVIFYSLTPFSLYIPNKQWNGSLYYSVDHNSWQEVHNATVYEAELNGSWYILYVRGESNTVLSGGSNGARWYISGKGIKCVGNLNNLLDHTQTITSIASKAMAHIFNKCASVDFDVTLPALQVGQNAYQSMFQDCASMTKAPDLPATTIGGSCYRDMFYGCTALTDIPDILPALTLDADCYDRMFGYCYSLKKCPKLPARTLGNYCYSSMFQDCYSLEQIPELPATTLKNYCYSSMFRGCSKIKISSTQSGEYQTEYRIPSVGMGTDATSTLSDMFSLTGGTFTGTPMLNVAFYTSNTIVPASTT